MSTDETNLIKSTCKALGLTYRELGERIGYGEDAIKKAAIAKEISTPMQKAIGLMLETKDLKEQLLKHEQLKALLKDMIE
jgi:hypothetical protein